MIIFLSFMTSSYDTSLYILKLYGYVRYKFVRKFVHNSVTAGLLSIVRSELRTCCKSRLPRGQMLNCCYQNSRSGDLSWIKNVESKVPNPVVCRRCRRNVAIPWRQVCVSLVSQQPCGQRLTSRLLMKLNEIANNNMCAVTGKRS